MENIEEFKKLYNFEFEEIKADSFEEISKKYLAAYKDGKEKGYTAVFLTVDDYLLKAFEITMKDENTDNMMDIYNKNLERAKSINPNDLFNKFLKQNIDESFTEADFKFDDSIKNNLKFSTVFDRNEILKNNVILVKVPSKKPY